jgi:hypothetical protein
MGKQRWLLGAAAGVCFVVMTGRAEAEPPERGRPPWRTEYEQARAAARTSGRPLFVVFRCEH